MNKVKIGFLPFYIKLYDDIGSGAKARPRLEPFAKKLADLIEERGFEVFLSSPSLTPLSSPLKRQDAPLS